jgi:hypothetical protein
MKKLALFFVAALAGGWINLLGGDANTSLTIFNLGGLLGATPSMKGYGPKRCNCSFTDIYPYAVGPRLGVAYQLARGTVLRAGWGLVYGTTADVNYQLFYSLRYRRFYSHFAEKHPDLTDMPLILTEGGFDTGGNPHKSGWQANGKAEQFEEWLTWWDEQLGQDPYVLGSTLFQIGDAGRQAILRPDSLDDLPSACQGRAAGSSPPLRCNGGDHGPSKRHGERLPPRGYPVIVAVSGSLAIVLADSAIVARGPVVGNLSGSPFNLLIISRARGLELTISPLRFITAKTSSFLRLWHCCRALVRSCIDTGLPSWVLITRYEAVSLP